MSSAVVEFRVRYCETDQMGTYSSARALDWFEHGRTELLRALGKPYAEMEDEGVLIPVVEAKVRYLGRARYDDLLRMEVSSAMSGRARVRFDFQIAHAETGRPVCEGYSIHAVTNPSGRPIRPPEWFVRVVEAQA